MTKEKEQKSVLDSVKKAGASRLEYDVSVYEKVSSHTLCKQRDSSGRSAQCEKVALLLLRCINCCDFPVKFSFEIKVSTNPGTGIPPFIS